MANNLILIVDDEPTGRQLLQAILLNSGYETILAENGNKAIELLKTTSPSLILLDIMMPEISGFEVIAKIKDDEKTKNIPIMLVSALNDRDNRIKGLELGAVDYISKPFDRIEILTKINNHIAKRELHQQNSNNNSDIIKLNYLINEIKNTVYPDLKSTLNLEGLFIDKEKLDVTGCWTLPYNKGICHVFIGSSHPEENDAFQLALVTIWLQVLINSKKNKADINQFLINKINTNQSFFEKQWWYVSLFCEENNKYYITGLNADIISLPQIIKDKTFQKSNLYTSLVENTFYDIDKCTKLLIHIGNKNQNLAKPEKVLEIATLIYNYNLDKLKLLLQELEGNPNHVTSYLINMD